MRQINDSIALLRAAHPFTWTGTVQGAVESLIREEDSSMAASVQQAEIHPVSPKAGAFVRKTPEDGEFTSPLLRFRSWVGEEEFITQDSDEPKKATDWEALTPAVYGLGYNRAVGLVPSSYPGRSVSVTGWRSVECVVRYDGSLQSNVWMANAVAALAPMLNPAFESPEEAVVRLTREKDAIEFSLRARMVAEGVARNWCGEFDPILDSTGLAPRQMKGWVTGTLKFRAELVGYDLNSEEVLKNIKSAPGSYIAMTNCTIETLEVEPGMNSPLLST